MIAALLLPLLLQAAPAPAITGLPLGAIGKQALPAKGCAAFLWSAGTENALVAMAVADPAQLRLAIDGKIADYARTSQTGGGGFGFAAVSEYRGGDVTATLDMAVVPRAGLSNGAAVPEGTLRIERPGKDSVVVPVAGLIGCS